MSIFFRLFACVALISCPSWADADHVKQMLLSTMDDPSPKIDERLARQLRTGAAGLKVEDYRSLLPLALECFKSSRESTRIAGFIVLRAAAESGSGSALLEPYVRDLGEGLKVSNPERRLILTILTSANPQLPPSAKPLFLAYLEDENVSEVDDFDDLTVVISLMVSFPSDLAMRRRVFKAVEHKSLGSVTLAALDGLNRVDQLGSDDLDFINACLKDDNPFVRAGTILQLAKRDSNVRAQFADRLKIIASDPDEPRDVRMAAQLFLEQKP